MNNSKNSIRRIIKINGQDYHVIAHFYNEDYLLYWKYIISKNAEAIAIFSLGITKVAVKIYNYKNEFNPPDWLFDQGLTMVNDMVRLNQFTQESGIITSWEMSKGEFDWRKLEKINLEEKYYR